MGSQPPDYVRKKFGPLLAKSLETALAHCIAVEFPRIGGPRIQQLCAAMILEVIAEHLRPREHVRHGQVLWLAINRDDPPRRNQRIRDCDLIPVVLDLSTPDDIHARIERNTVALRLTAKAVRLCQQAYNQGALLSNCDLAELLFTDDARIAHALAEHERSSGRLVPRRATLHDVGTCLTHKGIICWKRYAEGKDPDQVARETYHSLEAVDRYLGMYDRVRHCRLQGLSPAETAHVLRCNLGLVEQYLAIDRQLEARHA
jgi:DNA-binding CsgD family transcriptional regulator